MLLRVTFKTADAVNLALEDIGMLANDNDLQKTIDKFIKYREYVTIELDTEKGSARVIEV